MTSTVVAFDNIPALLRTTTLVVASGGAVCAGEDEGTIMSKANTTFDEATEDVSATDSIVELHEKSTVRLRTRPLADPSVAAL
jgi:hypothetical protein